MTPTSIAPHTERIQWKTEDGDRLPGRAEIPLTSIQAKGYTTRTDWLGLAFVAKNQRWTDWPRTGPGQLG